MSSTEEMHAAWRDLSMSDGCRVFINVGEVASMFKHEQDCRCYWHNFQAAIEHRGPHVATDEYGSTILTTEAGKLFVISDADALRKIIASVVV